MSKIEVSLSKAQTMVKEIVAARLKYGRKMSHPYTQDSLYDALVLLAANGALEQKTDDAAISAEDVTRLRRQLAACQNREKLRKGTADAIDVSDEGESGNV